MATPSAIAKRTEKRQIEILEAVNDLKTIFLKIGAAEGEVLEATVQVDELQAEILKAEFYNLKQQVAELSGQIAELKIVLTTSAPAVAVPADKSRRRPKK